MCLRKFKVSLSLLVKSTELTARSRKKFWTVQKCCPRIQSDTQPVSPLQYQTSHIFSLYCCRHSWPDLPTQRRGKKIQNLFEIFVCLCRNLLENHIKRKVMYNIEHTGTYKHTHFESKDIQYTHKAYRQTCDGLVFHLSLSYTFIFRNHIHNIHLATRTANIKI